jgi:hypothetical protein
MDCRVKPGNDGGNQGTSVLHPFDRDLLFSGRNDATSAFSCAFGLRT